MIVSRLFKLSDTFVEKYREINPPFGFNGLGELTYLRTYSRLKEDGTNEKWYETVRRVVEGTYSIQKHHIDSYKLGWNEEDAQMSAEEMYDRIEHVLNYFQYQLKGISFLPKVKGGSYHQMPYEAITEEEYLKRVSVLKELNFDREIGEDSKPELFCTSDTCVIL